MAIDRVTIWRNAPSGDIALDNELFLEAQESSFVQKPILLPVGSPARLIRIRVTRPSFVIGSFEFSDNTSTKVMAFAGDSGPMAGFSCNYTGYDSGNTAASTDIVNFTAAVTLSTQRLLIFAKVIPHVTVPYKEMYLNGYSSAAGTYLLPGSYLKIL
jgi:hypothetical protein